MISYAEAPLVSEVFEDRWWSREVGRDDPTVHRGEVHIKGFPSTNPVNVLLFIPQVDNLEVLEVTQRWQRESGAVSCNRGMPLGKGLLGLHYRSLFPTVYLPLASEIALTLHSLQELMRIRKLKRIYQADIVRVFILDICMFLLYFCLALEKFQSCVPLLHSLSLSKTFWTYIFWFGSIITGNITLKLFKKILINLHKSVQHYSFLCWFFWSA